MRPYVEFVQSQALPWAVAPAPFEALRWKCLSRDPANGAVTALLRVSGGALESAPTALDCATELFVLKGALRWGTLDLGTHAYVWLPRGWPLGTIAAMPFEGRHDDAIVLAFFDAQPCVASGAAALAAQDARALEALRTQITGPIDTVALRWDNVGVDPNIDHLNVSRKNLRFAPSGDCRTYLLCGMPQGYPPGPTPLETHPHVEEFFMVSGDMASHLGIMRTGAYFHRPAGIPHGRDCSRSGFLLFCRTPGSNRTISEWSAERHPVHWFPRYAPHLSDELAATIRATGAPLDREQPDPLEY